MGGDPQAIWQRGTLPMYYALQRYWGDHPRVDQLARAYLQIPPRYTPPPAADGTPAAPPLDWSLLDDPQPFAPVRPRQMRKIDDELRERFPAR